MFHSREREPIEQISPVTEFLGKKQQEKRQKGMKQKKSHRILKAIKKQEHAETSGRRIKERTLSQMGILM